MKKLTLSCDYGRFDNLEVQKIDKRVCIEIKMEIESDQPIILLSKQDAAKLVEFLNGLELE